MWYFIWTSGLGELERFTAFDSKADALAEVRAMEVAGNVSFELVQDWTDRLAWKLPNGHRIHVQQHAF